MTGNTVYLLDEPTTGLHFDDIKKLLDVLQRLVELGNTVVVIEHNLDVIKCADWIIDLGPGAGANGGDLVFAGTPEDLAAKSNSRRSSRSKQKAAKSNGSWYSDTGTFLAAVLRDSGKQDRPQSPAPKKSTPKQTDQLRIEPAEAAVPQAKGKPESTKTKRPRVKANAVVANEPWQVLGRRWHSLGKGFPADAAPDWPLELVDQILGLLERVAGDDSLTFEKPDRVDVRPEGIARTWAEVETKAPESLKVTLAGPREAIDLEQLSNLDIDGPVDASDEDHVKVTLKLTDRQTCQKPQVAVISETPLGTDRQRVTMSNSGLVSRDA